MLLSGIQNRGFQITRYMTNIFGDNKETKYHRILIIMNEKVYYVYILTSKRNGTLYIGVTNDLSRRIYEHKNDLINGFSKHYRVHLLVYYEEHEDVQNAIHREKQLKKWNRTWKLRLNEKYHPQWKDLCNEDNTILPIPKE